MLKKTISMLLAVMMVVSVMAVGVASAGAVVSKDFTPEANKFYFDVDGTGWDMGAKDKIAFYMVGGDFDTETNVTKPYDWGSKKLQGKAVDGETGLFYIEPEAIVDVNGNNYVLTPGKQYKIIFARVSSNSWKDQSCPLYFTTDCLGHVAYSDGTEMENDVDSTKKSKTVYWKGIDATENGPALVITSIGNVVGYCVEQGKTKYDLFVDFISEEKDDFKGKTGLQNARYYTVEQAKTKTEQQMIDDIGTALELSKNDVKKAFDENPDVETVWTITDSTIPEAHTHTPGEPQIENVTPATCGKDGKHDEIVYCTECKEKIEEECKYNVVDPATGDHTPGDPQEIEEGRIPAGCEKAGSHVEVTYCTVCGNEISRDTVVDKALGHSYPLQFVEEIPPTATKDGYKAHYVCVNCYKLFTDAEGKKEVTLEELTIPAAHVQGDASGNGACEIDDATVIQRLLAELPVTDNYDEVGADADGDGIVDIIDASLIQRVEAEITTFEAWNAKHPNKWSVAAD